MTDPHTRHLVVWEARHDNGWTTLVMEQLDGTFIVHQQLDRCDGA